MYILIVEDNVINAFLLKEVLILRGYEPIVALSMQEGLSLLKKKNLTFLAVFVDLTLPDGTGIMLAEKIKKMKKYRKIPLVAVTGADICGKKINNLFSNIIRKPIDIDILMKCKI